MGIFQKMLLLGQQLLQKLDDIDVQLTRVNHNLSTIEGELDKANKTLSKILAEETDIISLEVVVDKPVKQ